MAICNGRCWRNILMWSSLIRAAVVLLGGALFGLRKRCIREGRALPWD